MTAPDYDPDLDFPPLKLHPMGEKRDYLIDGKVGWDIPPCTGNSIKAQLEEIWNRPGVALTMHHPIWDYSPDGRITGFMRGRIYQWKPSKRKAWKKS